MILKILTSVIISAATALPVQSPAPQSSSDQYQMALILEVKEHQGQNGNKNTDRSTTAYDISLRVKDTVYVVLVDPPPGTVAGGLNYLVGTNKLVLIKSATITFNDMLGRSWTAPIISQRPAPQDNKHRIN